MTVANHFRAECEALDEILKSLPEDDWRRHTVFWDWSVWDEVVHLHYVDLCALASVTDPDQLRAMVAERRADQAAGLDLSARLRQTYADLSGAQLRRRWREGFETLCAAFDADDPDRRTGWFGPDMSVATLANARQMEVWAHGQDIYDLFAVRRRNHDRIRNICDLGVRTFGWSFRNRGLSPPASPPRVRLAAPAGGAWTWNPSGEGEVAGSAEDFALVVTQRRHVADTGLVLDGEAAREWMRIAQCFAGPPADGPQAGGRVVAYVPEV